MLPLLGCNIGSRCFWYRVRSYILANVSVAAEKCNNQPDHWLTTSLSTSPAVIKWRIQILTLTLFSLLQIFRPQKYVIFFKNIIFYVFIACKLNLNLKFIQADNKTDNWEAIWCTILKRIMRFNHPAYTIFPMVGKVTSFVNG